MSLSALRVPRTAALVILSLGVILVGLLAATRLVPGASATSVPEAEVRAAALAGLRAQYSALLPSDDSQARSLFTGKALAKELALRAHVHDLIRQDQDYPGVLELTNVQVLDVYGDGTAATLDIAAHGKLANMKAGTVQDYSESDVIYHVVVIREDGAWKVTDLAWEFAPGGEQP